MEIFCLLACVWRMHNVTSHTFLNLIKLVHELFSLVKRFEVFLYLISGITKSLIVKFIISITNLIPTKLITRFITKFITNLLAIVEFVIYLITTNFITNSITDLITKFIINFIIMVFVWRIFFIPQFTISLRRRSFRKIFGGWVIIFLFFLFWFFHC